MHLIFLVFCNEKNKNPAITSSNLPPSPSPFSTCLMSSTLHGHSHNCTPAHLSNANFIACVSAKRRNCKIYKSYNHFFLNFDLKVRRIDLQTLTRQQLLLCWLFLSSSGQVLNKFCDVGAIRAYTHARWIRYKVLQFFKIIKRIMQNEITSRFHCF